MTNAAITDEGRLASLTAITSSFAQPGPVTMILMNANHQFDQTIGRVAQIAGDEVVATGYARQLATFNAAARQDDGSFIQTSRVVLFGVVGGALDDTVSGCYLFWDTGLDSTAPVFACVPFAQAMTTDGTDLRVTEIYFVWSPSQF